MQDAYAQCGNASQRVEEGVSMLRCYGIIPTRFSLIQGIFGGRSLDALDVQEILVAEFRGDFAGK